MPGLPHGLAAEWADDGRYRLHRAVGTSAWGGCGGGLPAPFVRDRRPPNRPGLALPALRTQLDTMDFVTMDFVRRTRTRKYDLAREERLYVRKGDHEEL